MAAAESGAESDGSWDDYPAENPVRAAVLNREIARRAQLLQERLENGDWCRCGNCWPVLHAESADDVTCCHEQVEITAVRGQHALFGHADAYKCICMHPSFFHFCLYEMHLDHIAHLYKMDDVDLREIQRYKKLRYVAFRSFSGWIHGYLGRGNRRKIPQCVTKAIRQAFPSPTGQYRGYLQRRPEAGPQGHQQQPAQ